jgi:Protein of unknown function DUF58
MLTETSLVGNIMQRFSAALESCLTPYTKSNVDLLCGVGTTWSSDQTLTQRLEQFPSYVRTISSLLVEATANGGDKSLWERAFSLYSAAWAYEKYHDSPNAQTLFADSLGALESILREVPNRELDVVITEYLKARHLAPLSHQAFIGEVIGTSPLGALKAMPLPVPSDAHFSPDKPVDLGRGRVDPVHLGDASSGTLQLQVFLPNGDGVDLYELLHAQGREKLASNFYKEVSPQVLGDPSCAHIVYPLSPLSNSFYIPLPPGFKVKEITYLAIGGAPLSQSLSLTWCVLGGVKINEEPPSAASCVAYTVEPFELRLDNHFLEEIREAVLEVPSLPVPSETFPGSLQKRGLVGVDSREEWKGWWFDSRFAYSLDPLVDDFLKGPLDDPAIELKTGPCAVLAYLGNRSFREQGVPTIARISNPIVRKYWSRDLHEDLLVILEPQMGGSVMGCTIPLDPTRLVPSCASLSWSDSNLFIGTVEGKSGVTLPKSQVLLIDDMRWILRAQGVPPEPWLFARDDEGWMRGRMVAHKLFWEKVGKVNNSSSLPDLVELITSTPIPLSASPARLAAMASQDGPFFPSVCSTLAHLCEQRLGSSESSLSEFYRALVVPQSEELRSHPEARIDYAVSRVKAIPPEVLEVIIKRERMLKCDYGTLLLFAQALSLVVVSAQKEAVCARLSTGFSAPHFVKVVERGAEDLGQALGATLDAFDPEGKSCDRIEAMVLSRALRLTSPENAGHYASRYAIALATAESLTPYGARLHKACASEEVVPLSEGPAVQSAVLLEYFEVGVADYRTLDEGAIGKFRDSINSRSRPFTQCPEVALLRMLSERPPLEGSRIDAVASMLFLKKPETELGFSIETDHKPFRIEYVKAFFNLGKRQEGFTDLTFQLGSSSPPINLSWLSSLLSELVPSTLAPCTAAIQLSPRELLFNHLLGLIRDVHPNGFNDIIKIIKLNPAFGSIEDIDPREVLIRGLIRNIPFKSLYLSLLVQQSEGESQELFASVNSLVWDRNKIVPSSLPNVVAQFHLECQRVDPSISLEDCARSVSAFFVFMDLTEKTTLPELKSRKNPTPSSFLVNGSFTSDPWRAFRPVLGDCTEVIFSQGPCQRGKRWAMVLEGVSQLDDDPAPLRRRIADLIQDTIRVAARAAEAQARFPRPGEGDEVREYRYGDPARHIAWKASAKAGELRTKISTQGTVPQKSGPDTLEVDLNHFATILFHRGKGVFRHEFSEALSTIDPSNGVIVIGTFRGEEVLRCSGTRFQSLKRPIAEKLASAVQLIAREYRPE